jgi:hypothetical protein
VRNFRLLVLIFIVASISNISKAQTFELREIVGIQTTWKGIDLSLSNMNFFKSRGEWIQNNTRFTLVLPSKNSFNLGLGYQRNYVDVNEGLRIENRPIIFVRYTKQLGNFNFRDTNTMELRFLEGKFLKRYRNLIELRFEKHEIFKPYIMTEAFFQFDKFEYVRQRLTLGMRFPINRVLLNFFTFYEMSKVNPKWKERESVAISVIYRL